MATVKVTIPEYKTCKSADLIAWCKENGQVAWLKETSENSKNFFVLRKAFYTKFAPDMLPTKTKKTYKDLIASL